MKLLYSLMMCVMLMMLSICSNAESYPVIEWTEYETPQTSQTEMPEHTRELIPQLTVAPIVEEPAWVGAYKQVLSEQKGKMSEEDRGNPIYQFSYFLYDIDKDGIPEMAVKTGNGEANYLGSIYTFRDGHACKTGEDFSLGHSGFYSDPSENGIILMFGHMGYAFAMRITLAEGNTEEVLLYEDNLNDRLQDDPDADYIYPGDVISGSVELSPCRGDLTLALMHYKEISQCVNGELFSPMKKHYPDNNEAFYDELMANNGDVIAVAADEFTNSPGKIGFQGLLRKDVAANWMSGDLIVISTEVADLNGDGQLECVVTASDDGNEMRIVLSEQENTVFAYIINYTDGYELDAEGCFLSTLFSMQRYRMIFDAQEAYLINVPESRIR